MTTYEEIKHPTVTMALADLVPADYNPRQDLRKGDAEFESLRTSISEFGMLEPIIWNKRTGHIVGGHQRVKVLIDEGVTTADVIVVDFPLSKEKAANLALNRIGGGWDDAKLQTLLSELVDDMEVNLESTGFGADEIEALLADMQRGTGTGARDDDFNPDEIASEITDPFTRPGDIWLLGRHRLICGDSRDKETMAKLVDGKRMQLVITDPPYNVAYVGKTSDALTIENDQMGDIEFYTFLYEAYLRMFEVMDDGAGIYVFHADSEGANFRRAMVDAGLKLAQCCIWKKNSIVMGRQDYHWQHEPVLYGWKPTGAHHWYSDRKQSTIWEYDRPSRSSEHPTMKPVELIGYPLGNSSKEGDNVLDSFCGSGSTLVACEQTNRTCYAIELDPVYCDVILTRYMKLTGETVRRVSDGRTLRLVENALSE